VDAAALGALAALLPILATLTPEARAALQGMLKGLDGAAP
jgi:hypothetical protein